MTNQPSKVGYTKWTRIAVTLAAVSFCIYVLNVLIGKANIVYGWGIFHFGSIAEFLILFLASIMFVAAALLQEATWKSNPEPDHKEGKL